MAIAVRTRSAAKAAQASCEAVVRSTVPSVRAVNLGKFSGRRGKHHEVQVVVKEEIHETLVDQRVTVTPAKQSRKRGLRNEKAEKVTKKVRSGAHAALTITDDAPFNNPATTTTIKTPTKSPVKAPLPPRQPPKGWLETYSLIKELREPRDAPVDSMGCEALVQQPPEVDPKTSRYQVLIALMLSSQTKDQTVAEAMRNLQAHGLTVENILATDPAKLNSLIAKVGFHNNKTKFILQATQILKERHGSDVPATLDELVALPGVGPKMAFITLSAAHGIDPGIGIDTHMHRIMNEIGWVSSKDPEATRVQLESWLPKEHWSKVNVDFVGFGQMIQQTLDSERFFKKHRGTQFLEEEERAKLLKRCCMSSQPKEALKLVVKVGVPLATVCKSSRETVLHWACMRGDTELVDYLLQKLGRKALEATDKNGRRPVDYTSSDSVRALLEGIA